MFQDETVWSENSPYHLACDFASLKNWSFNRPPASELWEEYPSTKVMLNLLNFQHSQSSVGFWTNTLPGTEAFGPAKGLSSEVLVELSMSGTWDQPIKERIPLIVSPYVCSSEMDCSCSVTVMSWSSDNSPSSTYSSSGGQSETSLSSSKLKLETLSFLGLCKTGESVPVGSEDFGRSVWGRLDWSLLVDWCFTAEKSVPVSGWTIRRVLD